MERAKDRYGNDASCKDGNDLYRPIKEAGQRSQATKPHNQKCGKQSQRQRMTRDVEVVKGEVKQSNLEKFLLSKENKATKLSSLLLDVLFQYENNTQISTWVHVHT